MPHTMSFVMTRDGSAAANTIIQMEHMEYLQMLANNAKYPLKLFNYLPIEPNQVKKLKLKTN